MEASGHDIGGDRGPDQEGEGRRCRCRAEPADRSGSRAARSLASAVEVIAGFVSGFEPGRYDGEDAAALVATFNRAERLCQAGKTLAAARVVESHRHTHEGHRSGAEWLASVTGESVGRSVDVLRLGESLADHPGIEDAYREGRLSAERAVLVTGAARVNPQRETELVERAGHDTLRRLKERCLRAKAEGRSAKDAEAAYAAILGARRCRTWTDPEGAFRLDARLCPDAGAALAAALGAEADRCFERGRTTGVHESKDAYAADALVALVTGRGALPTEAPGGPGGPGVPDGVGAGAGAGEAAGGPGPGGPGVPSGRRAPGPRATVHVRVDLDALRRGSLDAGEVCEIPGVGPVPVQTARDLLGDALVDLVITNGTDVTTVCHLGRSIPAALDVALTERDRRCVVPGCDATQGLERDHWIVSFKDGGPATLENLARLCSHHHYLRTHRGFSLHGGPGRWRWEPPDHPLGSSRGRSRPRPRRPTGSSGSSGSSKTKAPTRPTGPRPTGPGDPTCSPAGSDAVLACGLDSPVSDSMGPPSH